jgi:hypothetical protein
LKPGDKAAQ